jgi:hypothetical protein
MQIIAAGLVHLCTPGPQSGWPHRVQDDLDARDAAAEAERTAEYGTDNWRAAYAKRLGAETRLAIAFDLPAVRTGCR